MNISQQEFQFMVEAITSDLIQLLIDRDGYTLPQAVSAVYDSHIYQSLLRPQSNLFFQSAGHVYAYLSDELKAKDNLSN
ncbi:MAG: hypothetical protein IJM84_02355 [Bacteroidaceae bacterium]|nr:hypothetical protein [Bacteroidaceae bacterium]